MENYNSKFKIIEVLFVIFIFDVSILKYYESLLLRNRATLMNGHEVSDLPRVAGIMRLITFPRRNILLVLRNTGVARYRNDYRILHLVRNDNTFKCAAAHHMFFLHFHRNSWGTLHQ